MRRGSNADVGFVSSAKWLSAGSADSPPTAAEYGGQHEERVRTNSVPVYAGVDAVEYPHPRPVPAPSSGSNRQQTLS